MFIRDTENFKPGDPATHVKFKRSENPKGKILIILTPDGQLVPYSPKDHNDATQANGIREGFTIVPMARRTYYDKTLDRRNLQKKSQNPTQEEIDILFSPEIDAYVAEGFDPSKGDDNEKYDSRKHDVATKILVLKKRIFGSGYESYKPSQHGANADEFKSITLNSYRSTRSVARKEYKKWIGEYNTDIDISRLLPQIPGQRENDIFTSKKIEAYVTKGFDPSKGDDNEKYNPPKHGQKDEILVLKKKLFGGGYEPYKPSQHGINADEFKSITVGNFFTARFRARKAYELWKKNNPISTSTTTSATNITSTTTTTSSSTTTTTNSNQVRAKRFNPILLINDYESLSEIKEQGTDNSVTASRTVNTSQQKKRAADDSVSNSTPFFTRNVLTLFQGVDEPAVSKDPTEPKRLRLND